MSPEIKKPDAKAPKKATGALKEFLNPHSMLTPGLCGGITLLITNTLAAQFAAPPNYTGLGISCLFGLIVFAATSTVLWLRLVFWVLNSLIIFSIALGTNQIGVRASKNISTKALLPVPLASTTNRYLYIHTWPFKTFFANWLDGTVPRRKTLLMQVPKIDEWEAQEALKALGISFQSQKPELAKLVLENYSATAQTYERVAEIERAIAKAQAEKENIGPDGPR
jgi:hypothetical protein